LREAPLCQSHMHRNCFHRFAPRFSGHRKLLPVRPHVRRRTGLNSRVVASDGSGDRCVLEPPASPSVRSAHRDFYIDRRIRLSTIKGPSACPTLMETSFGTGQTRGLIHGPARTGGNSPTGHRAHHRLRMLRRGESGRALIGVAARHYACEDIISGLGAEQRFPQDQPSGSRPAIGRRSPGSSTPLHKCVENSSAAISP
jgi:hypothetical protein